MLVGRRVYRDDAEVAAPLLEETVDVDGLRVRLDGDGGRSFVMLGDVCEELVEHVCSLRLGLHQIGVSVGRRSAHEDDEVPHS